MNEGHGGLGALALLARGLTGIDVEVQTLPGARPVLAGRRLLLPASTRMPPSGSGVPSTSTVTTPRLTPSGFSTLMRYTARPRR